MFLKIDRSLRIRLRVPHDAAAGVPRWGDRGNSLPGENLPGQLVEEPVLPHQLRVSLRRKYGLCELNVYITN